MARVRHLHDQGLFLQAFEAASAIGPLRNWAGTQAQLLAGRLAGNLGGVRLGRHLILNAWRHDRDDPDACWHYARHLLDSYGSWAALQFMERRGGFDDADREARSHWLALHAQAYGRARDFERASHWLAQAEAIGGDDPWVLLERASLCAMDDRVEDAIAAARKALEVRPWHRLAVLWLAHFLMQKEQDFEALRLLEEANGRIESYGVSLQWGDALMEVERYAEAREAYDRCERLAPLLDKVTRPYLAARRCDAAYLCGDLAKAGEWAREAKGRFYEVQAERLKEPLPAERRRVCIPVGFVRQHHWTCAPATLAALCRYWNMPGDHLEVAPAITYAGTAAHSERQWAIDNGWFTKEFTVTRDSARRLIDAGIPFTLTTTEVSSAHLQAVIGYDDLRDVLILRDPGSRHQVEMLVEGLDRYRASGPRGHALVPMAEKGRLESLELPDADAYDQIFRMERALDAHDRDAAEAVARELAASGGEARLVALAEQILAAYDADTVGLLTAVSKLAEAYPDDLRLQHSRASLRRDHASREEFLATLETLSKQPKSDPAIWTRFAFELSSDAREYPEAERWLKRAIRANPGSGRGFSLLASIRWAERRFDDGLALSRLAACLEDTDEGLARTYFEYANLLGRGAEGLAFLRRRFERFGKNSGQPAQSLAWAHFFLERANAGYAVLEEAMRLRPDDAELQLAVVDQYVVHGKFREARAVAARVRRKSHRAAWLRSVANLEANQGNLQRARALWARVLALQPLAEDAHRAFALTLAETVGRHAALDHLHAVCERFPHHFRLTQLWMEWRREDGPDAVEPIVRRLIELHPSDAWARRQLALTLAEANRLDEAFAALAAAEPFEPASLGYHGVSAALLTQAGRFDEAREHHRATLRLSVDATFAMSELVQLSQSQDERREALAFVASELTRQVTSGAGLLTFRDLASTSLEPEELLALLNEALTARPDLWQSWAVVVRQLRFMERLDDAAEQARAALERFPLTSDLWVDLADVEQARRNEDAALAALQTAHGISPHWPEPVRRLSEIHRLRDEPDQGQALLERAVARAPLRAENHAVLARFLWDVERRHDAFERMRTAVRVDPGLDNAWDQLCEWAAQLGCYQTVVDLARDQATKRPGEIRSWMRLAQALRAIPGDALVDDAERQEEVLAALDRVIALRPWHTDAYDLKAQVLVDAQRWTEAQAACQAPAWKGKPPTALRGRLAWIKFQRGNQAEAVRMMTEVVRSDPDYYWGWLQLAEWHPQLGNRAEHLEAAERLVAFDPYQPISYVRRAEAKLALEDRAGAIADYRRASELAPAYLWPVFQLFDLHVEDGDFTAARAVLDGADPTQAPSEFLVRSIRLALVAKDVASAQADLEDLCRAGGDGIEDAVAAMEEADQGAIAEDVLRRYLGGGANMCREWVALVARRSSLEAVRPQIESLAPRHLARIPVTCAYANALADAGRADLLVDWVHANDALLRKRTPAWGDIGSCFSKVLDDERVAAWMGDWKQRENVQPWMLINLSLSLRGLDRFEEGAEVNRHVLDQFDSDYTSLFHRVWLTMDAALAGDGDAVAAFFRDHELAELDANHQWVAALARGAWTCLTADDPIAALADVEANLRTLAAESDPLDRDEVWRLVYRKAIRKMAEVSGAVGSDWERNLLETPIAPPLKPKPGESSDPVENDAPQ